MELSEISIVALIVCFYQFVFRWLSPKLCKWIVPSYKDFSSNDRKHVDTGNSTLCNTLVVMIFVVLTFNEGIIFEQPIWGKSSYVTWNIRNALAYAISDLQILVFCYTTVLSRHSLIFHHSCCVVVLAMQLYMGTFGYLGSLRVLTEVIQPCFVFKSYMVQRGLKKSKMYMMNGLLLTILYFLSRIMIIPLIWIPYLNEETLKYYRQYPANTVVLIVTEIIFDVLNIYWFSRILKAIFSILRKRKE